MKLTKAQRLFIKVGRMETMINGLAYKIQRDPLSSAISDAQGALKRMRRQRKRLIREALKESEEFDWLAYVEEQLHKIRLEKEYGIYDN